ncbi:GNAT family N-acetyltransferase [Congregibacter litoralis]|uniref:GNAT family N-acetyltransferase n=1 Tax=Congregibacter litoralis TaxID=393662 RepID=UPI00058FB5A3|nr:GNAT family N-acetyltransferase [Congregibacter litoralis]
MSDVQLRLREFRAEDASRVAQLVGDKELSKWTSSIPYPYSLEDAQVWIESMKTDSSRSSYAVEWDGKLVACVAHWPEEPDGIEVGYWVGREYWGKGIGSKALGLLLVSGHISPETDIYAKVMAANIGSRRVLEKCGFSFYENGRIHKAGNDLEAKFYIRRARAS